MLSEIMFQKEQAINLTLIKEICSVATFVVVISLNVFLNVTNPVFSLLFNKL